MTPDDQLPSLTTDCVARFAAASGIAVDPERLAAVMAVLEELFALERELYGVEITEQGDRRPTSGART